MVNNVADRLTFDAAFAMCSGMIRMAAMIESSSLDSFLLFVSKFICFGLD